MNVEKQSYEAVFLTKQNNAMKLEMKLNSTEKEADDLRHCITELETDKQNLKQKMSDLNISLASFQIEKDSLQTQLNEVRISEASAVATLEKLKDINRTLEANKRQLTKSLKEVTEKKIMLDKDNASLEEERVEKEDKMQLLKGENLRLSNEVHHLRMNLDKAETLLQDIQSERDKLSHEAAIHSEALGMVNSALAAVQIQRGKLNNTIAKLAQEKGDLISENISSSADIARTKENLKLAEERCTSLASINERQVKDLEDLKCKNTEKENDVADLEKKILSLQMEKNKILSENKRVIRGKNEDASHRLDLKDAELQAAMMATKTVESELSAAIQQVQIVAEREMSEMTTVMRNEMKSQAEYHQKVVENLEEKIDSTSKARKVELSREIKLKELAAGQFEDEKEALNQRFEKIHKMYEDKCIEAHDQYEQSNRIVSEQRSQLDTCNINAQHLESELSIAEQCIHDLHNKLDKVKGEAMVQVESFQSELKNASLALSQQESLHNDSLITIQKVEEQRDTLQKEKNETQKNFESLLNENMDMQNIYNSCQQDLVLMEKELVKAKEELEGLQLKLKETESAQILSENDASFAHKNLSKVENLHAQLVSDHAALQATLTNSEQQKMTFQLDLKSAQNTIALLEKKKESFMANESVLDNRLTFANQLSELREKEIKDIHQKVINLEQEKNELNKNLTEVQESLCTQGKVDAEMKKELKSQVSNLQTLRDSLKREVDILKMAIEATKNELAETKSELTATCGQASSLAIKLNYSTAELTYLRSMYTELIGVLSGTLGVALHAENFSPPGAIPTYTTQVESDIGDSMSASSNSSLHNLCQGMNNLSITICSDSVREAILELQENLIVAEKLRVQALSSADTFEKNIGQLENGKKLLEDRFSSLNSSYTSLREKFDTLSREHIKGEALANIHQKNVETLEKAKQQLEFEVACLHQQVETHGLAKHKAEKQVKKLAITQAESEMDIKKHQMHMVELELQIKQQSETISKQKALVSVLQSSQDKSEAEILSFQNKLVSSQQALLETENELRSVKESKQDMEDVMCKLNKNLDKLKGNFIGAQNQNLSLDGKITDLNREAEEMNTEACTLMNKFGMLTNSLFEMKTEKKQLQNKIKQLKESISVKAECHKELVLTIEKMQSQLDQKEHQNKEVKKEMALLIQERDEICLHMKQVKEELQEAIKEIQRADELCGSLETERDFLHLELGKIREDNLYLREELKKANQQSHRLDVLMNTQLKQKSELDASLINSSQRTVELLKNMREERVSAAERDKESKEKLAPSTDHDVVHIISIS